MNKDYQREQLRRMLENPMLQSGIYLIDTDLACVLKIVTNSIDDNSENVFAFDESIPLLNTILCAVALQLIAYSKYMNAEEL